MNVNPTAKNLKKKESSMMNGDHLLDDEMSSSSSTTTPTSTTGSDSVRASESSQTSMSPLVSDEESEADLEALKSSCMRRLMESEELGARRGGEIDELEREFKQIVESDGEGLGGGGGEVGEETGEEGGDVAETDEIGGGLAAPSSKDK